MYKIESLKNLKKTHHLIKNSTTGSPNEFAKKLGITRRKLFSHLEFLREIGAIITYDRPQETYYYENYFDLKIELSITVETDPGKRTLFSIK